MLIKRPKGEMVGNQTGEVRTPPSWGTAGDDEGVQVYSESVAGSSPRPRPDCSASAVGKNGGSYAMAIQQVDCCLENGQNAHRACLHYTKA